MATRGQKIQADNHGITRHHNIDIDTTKTMHSVGSLRTSATDFVRQHCVDLSKSTGAVNTTPGAKLFCKIWWMALSDLVQHNGENKHCLQQQTVLGLGMLTCNKKQTNTVSLALAALMNVFVN